MQDAFRDAWYALDTQAKGYVTVRDLDTYMRRQNYEDAFVTKWMTKFDKDKSGTIELHEYCDELGLNFKMMNAEIRMRISGGAGLPAGVEFISGDMDLSWQIKIAQLCLEGLRTNSQMKDVPKWIKTSADRLYNQLWHVVIVSGQFWCYYGHEPGYSFVFRYEKHIFIIWKTPIA